MFVYLTAAFTLAFYLSAVPVKLALMLRVSNRPGFGAGAAIFEGRYALRRAGRRTLGEKKHLPWKRADKDIRKNPIALRTSRLLLKSMRVESICAQGRIGLPDAAQTALACGFVRSAEGALGAWIGPGAVRFDLEPDFAGGGIDLVLWGMFSIHIGQIILAALNGARETISDFVSRRIQQWTSIPLKTS